jgi:AcrR family transcriptional regulator
MQLTRKRIIATAMELIEREGVEAVSMRRLATELGCGVMSLYSHIPSRSVLLDGVADAVMSGIEISAMPDRDWDAEIRSQARALRQIARAHPRCAMVVVSRSPSSASTLRPVEHALSVLRSAGFGGQEAVRIVRAFVAYVMGCQLHELGGTASRADADDAEPRHLRLRAADFPQVSNLLAELRDSDPDADFEFGLDLLVHAVAALRSARVPSRSVADQQILCTQP